MMRFDFLIIDDGFMELMLENAHQLLKAQRSLTMFIFDEDKPQFTEDKGLINTWFHEFFFEDGMDEETYFLFLLCFMASF